MTAHKTLHREALALLAGLLLLFAGCEHKELDHFWGTTASDVEVVFDWKKAPDADVKSMTLYMYPEAYDMSQYWFSNKTGGVIQAYSGSQTAICMDNDNTYGILVRNQKKHQTLEIYTDDVAVMHGQGISTRGIPRAAGTEDEPLRATPPLCYGSYLTDIDLKALTRRQTITFYPEELICYYTVEFIDVKNLQNADLRIDGTLSSMAGGFLPGTLTATRERVSHTFVLSADESLTALTGNFLTFGVPAGDEIPHMLCVYIVLKNRSGNSYTFDVSDQVNNAPDPRHVHIKIYGLELPDLSPSDPGPGSDPDPGPDPGPGSDPDPGPDPGPGSDPDPGPDPGPGSDPDPGPDPGPDPPDEGGMGVSIDDWHNVVFDIKV